MVRVPRYEKMARIKKGPWSIEEDQILINHIQNYGHANWRALPKQAGLLRCGKSCRLRWINYLRPDIKRGNFTREEEDAIVHLHQLLGNRWSAIAAKLPGRTDNEIKNVWHTHLKKRLKQRSCHKQTKSAHNNNNNSNNIHKIEPLEASNSNVPMKSCSGENSSSTTSETNLSEIDKSLWSSSEALFSREEEALLIESSSNPFEISEDLSESNLLSPFNFMNNSMELSSSYDYSPNIVDDLDYFLYNNNNNNNSNNILKIESLEASNSNVPMKSCSGENSSSTTSETNLSEIDKSLWSSSEALFSREEEALLIESSSNPLEISEDLSESNLLSPFNFMNNSMELSSSYDYNPNIVDDLDYFWYDVFIRAGGTILA